jgi:haloalkane dehalogenase
MLKERYQYPFQSRYAVVDGIKLHYIDEGAGPVLWMLHGMPTWSYVYRKMIPPLVAAGYRCVAPDLMGFGLSEKPEDEKAHSVQRHVGLMTGLIDKLGLKDIIGMGQDWGGPIMLRYAIEHKSNVRALVLLNTFIERFPENEKERRHNDIITCPLPPGYRLLFKCGGISSLLVKRADVFRKFVWRLWRSGNPSQMLGAGVRRPVDAEAMQNYLAAHDTPDKRAGIAAFAKLIPDRQDHRNARMIDQIRQELASWRVPMLVVWPDGDMAWKAGEGRRIAALVPGGEFYLVQNAGHYVQEDAGEEVARRVSEFLDRRLKAVPPATRTSIKDRNQPRAQI